MLKKDNKEAEARRPMSRLAAFSKRDGTFG
ncbi:hypothetical protein FHS16_006193 [Paenibacillus endophyticus]|uniref:Uncharacterized protein n=1 Tax=Paenibacillus endophyticus TaxID=1294268 RepID=A0A7W5CEB2_9BACL|nr:hypothetical protein [Paenibacillus endophyticus]